MAILKGLVIASVGDIKDSSRTRINNEDLKKWIVNNGGRWAPKVDSSTTHLISSEDAYQRSAEAVQKAKKLGSFIISYDWLEDCLHKRRKLVERKYTWDALQTQKRRRKQLKKLGPAADANKFNAGCELAKQDLGSGTSKKRSGGFFSSALDDLKRKREAREAEEKAKQAQTAKTSSDPEQISCSPKRGLVSLNPPTLPRTAPQGSPSQEQQQPEEACTLTQDTHTIGSTESTAPVTPKPSLFPPSLKYTPPSSSLESRPETHSGTPKLTPTAPIKPAVTRPANPKLEDLYHIWLDSTGFEYKLLLLRSNPYLNNFARYDLRLYESHTKPHVYCTVVRYTPPAGTKPGVASTTTPSTQSSGHPTPQASTTCHPNTPQNQTIHPMATHLTSLITHLTPTPSPALPYRTAIAPPNSDFRTAFLAFRHAFRDLTLLSWHERLDAPLQKLRAQAFRIEPFVWRRPAEGLPTGFEPPVPLGEQADVRVEGYTRNRWGLPGVEEPLGREGGIGSALFREAEEVRRQREEESKKEKENVLRARNAGVGKKGGNRKQGIGEGRVAAPRYYEPVQRQVSGMGGRPDGNGTVGGAGVGRQGGGLTPASVAQRSGRAIFVDYRSPSQKRLGGRFDY